MNAAFFPSRLSLALGVMLLAGAVQTICAQPSNWVLQTFDFGICGWNSFSPVALAFDPTQDDTGNGGGSCHVSFDLSQGGFFNLTATFESCCFCDSEVHLPLNTFASVDFDVKWDNASTVTPAQFNSNPGLGSPGIAIGPMNGSNLVYFGYPTICYSDVYIPNSATSGWVHVSVPINPASVYSTNGGIGIYLVETFAAKSSGRAVFWLDNVQLMGLKPPQFIPAMASRSGNNFTLQWTANPGSTCTVLKSVDFVHWSTVVSGYPTGGLTTSTVSYTDTVATNSQCFYRIRTP